MRVARVAAIGAATLIGAASLIFAATVHPAAVPLPFAQGRPPEDVAAVAASIPLEEAVDRIHACGVGAAAPPGSCAVIVYVWSASMPLSATGIAEVRRATQPLGAELLIVRGSELEARADSGDPRDSHRDAIPAEMISAGATLHYPSLLVYRSGTLAGAAMLGYKTGPAYRAMIAERLRGGGPQTPPLRHTATTLPADSLELSVEFTVPGTPGAYFRSVPGRRTLAFERARTIYLLDLTDGSTTVAPGTIDFVPSPDGRLFVTPGRNGRGLEFYDAVEVFTRASQGAGRRVQPVHVDPELRDQYPSIGILEHDSTYTGVRTVYRVLTSWFDGIAFRDFVVRRSGARGSLRVQPLGPRRTACPRVSIPILAPDGRHLAGRDENTATTRIFQIGAQGVCREVADLGLQSGKVAWSPEADRLAFAVPGGVSRGGVGRPGRGGSGTPGTAGIFVYDRSTGETRRIPGSADADRLTFPDFVGRDSLVFLLTPGPVRTRSVFRLICCDR